MTPDSLIIHYDEIGLKGQNRGFFERKLMDNIRSKIKEHKLKGVVKKLYSGVLIESDDLKETKKWEKALTTTFGIANFSFVFKEELGLKKITAKAFEIAKSEKFKNFRVTTRRSNKNFKLTSQELNTQVGEEIFEKLNKEVKLKNPDLEIHIEINEKHALIFTKKIQGLGGLPVGSSASAIVLASGGIDSPIAAWYALKRGIEPIFVHFHSHPYTSDASIEKVKALVKKLEKYNSGLKLYLCPFAELQKELLYKIPEKLRIIMYRRFMFRIAEKLAIREKAKALVTGESVGQVASQTLENIGVIEQATILPILRPLCGFDKKEIIEKAKEIGTFDISILPHDDCCTMFMPQNPETRGKIDEVLKLEEDMDIEEMVDKALSSCEITNVSS